jgi:hypothetical protein
VAIAELQEFFDLCLDAREERKTPIRLEFILLTDKNFSHCQILSPHHVKIQKYFYTQSGISKFIKEEIL